MRVKLGVLFRIQTTKQTVEEEKFSRSLKSVLAGFSAHKLLVQVLKFAV